MDDRVTVSSLVAQLHHACSVRPDSVSVTALMALRHVVFSALLLLAHGLQKGGPAGCRGVYWAGVAKGEPNEQIHRGVIMAVSSVLSSAQSGGDLVYVSNADDGDIGMYTRRPTVCPAGIALPGRSWGR